MTIDLLPQYTINESSRYAQGDILNFASFGINNDPIGSSLINFSYAVVMNQDCDLNSDFLNFQKNEQDDSKGKEKHNNILDNILLCPAFIFDELCGGTHKPGKVMLPILGKGVDKLKSNNEMKRYHYLPGDADCKIPDLVLDFKTFISFDRNVLYDNYKSLYYASINILYRESLSQRFSYFLGRIGLPGGEE